MSGKPLRFGALVRVSTEKQEQQGESLRTQRADNEQNVSSLGGKIVQWYGGQEHATPGWETAEVDRLLADAAKGKLDAVIVPHPDRWSRDNARSKEGLDVLRAHKVRFFVGSQEYDLFNPVAKLFLGVSAEIGEFQAGLQNLKSTTNRIARARRGVPTGGKLPFGRLYDRKTGEWSLDPEKQAVIRDIAARYLKGESLNRLAKEYNLNHPNLCKILREQSGEEWSINFKVPSLNIDETVPFKVPRLLDKETEKAVQHRLKANRTYLLRPPLLRHTYLLRGFVFCSGCGYRMNGQTSPEGNRYYRHPHADRERPCPLDPPPWVRAERLEAAVIGELFRMFGSPAAIERAVRAAVPDCDKVLKQRERLRADLDKVVKARARVVDAIADGMLSKDQAKAKLDELAERESLIGTELDKVAALLADLPDDDAVRCYVENAGGLIFVYDDHGNCDYPGGNTVGTLLDMTDLDKRVLVESVFNVPMPDGKPAGIYLNPVSGGRFCRSKQFTYTMHGRLAWRVMPRVLPPP